MLRGTITRIAPYGKFFGTNHIYREKDVDMVHGSLHKNSNFRGWKYGFGVGLNSPKWLSTPKTLKVWRKKRKATVI